MQNYLSKPAIGIGLGKDSVAFNFTEVQADIGFWLWSSSLSCAAYNTLGVSCWLDFRSQTLCVFHGCAHPVSGRPKSKPTPYFSDFWVQLSLPWYGWHLLKFPLQGTLGLELLTRHRSSQFTVHWYFSPWWPLRSPAFTVSIDMSVNHITFLHRESSQGESVICHLLFLPWVCLFTFPMSPDSPFRSFLSTRNPPPSFSSSTNYYIPMFRFESQRVQHAPAYSSAIFPEVYLHF